MAEGNKIQRTRFNNEMKQFVSFVKKRNKVSDAEIQASWANVERLASARFSAESKKRRRLKLLAGLSVAASAAILLFISFPLFNPAEDLSILTELEKNATSIDSLNQIKLVLSDRRHVELENEAILNYDREGSVTVNNWPSTVVKASIEEKSRLNHIIVPKGRRMHITLSDGTKMYVNAASHVIYPSVFDDGKREIAVEGEIYLEVAHNPEAPFIVNTKGLSVKVLGTVFNVSAYKEHDILVVLVTGSVEVRSSAKEKMLLRPSQMASLKDGIMKKEEVDVTKYICWKDNVMLLDNDPVSEVVNRISRYYGISIGYDKNIESRKLSGKLDLSDSIDDVLDVIKVSASLNMQKSADGGYHFLEQERK
ncbi:MAG: FecR domain-containing protein [Tannerellaceae bacterium]|jgi:ferric-dicitrate binding protein FerR (iron transport regulator)|nr:FecR domain-containing protein [Tannerellaceae bacterium]